jgi:hypothetical protein
MPHDVECTHCRVLMTSWSVPGSPVRYWQCPFCGRTHSSLYSEVFERGAGARRIDRTPVEAGPASGSAGLPQATLEEIRWTQLKARAAKWFARLQEEELPPPRPRSSMAARPAYAAVKISPPSRRR